MWRAILKFGCACIAVLRVYYRWSGLYRILFERKYKNVRIPLRQYVSEITDFVAKRVWEKDGWRTGGDAISYPGKLQYAADNGLDGRIGSLDCDDMSIYCVASINKMIDKSA